MSINLCPFSNSLKVDARYVKKKKLRKKDQHDTYMACIHNRLPERGVWELQLNTDPVRTEGRIQLKKKATYRSYSKNTLK